APADTPAAPAHPAGTGGTRFAPPTRTVGGTAAARPIAGTGPIATATRTVGGTATTRTIAAARPIACAGAIAAAWPIACAGAITAAWPIPVRTKSGLAGVSTEVHTHLRAVANGGPLIEFVRDILVVVTDTVAMVGVVGPVIAGVNIIDVDGAIDVNVVAAPVHAAPPVVSTGCPTSNSIACAERKPGGNRRTCDISRVWRRPVVGRICRRRPRTIDHRRVVIRHVDRLRIRRLDHDDLLAAVAFLGDRLLLCRLELVVRIGPGAQPLNGVHHIGLLCQHGIAELLRPVELAAHHGENARRGG